MNPRIYQLLYRFVQNLDRHRATRPFVGVVAGLIVCVLAWRVKRAVTKIIKNGTVRDLRFMEDVFERNQWTQVAEAMRRAGAYEEFVVARDARFPWRSR